MTAKSPRNKTLALTDAQLDEYLKQCPPLGKSAKLSEIEDRVLNQEILDALQYLPSDSIDLLLVDPPYNLTKQYGENKFAKVKFDEGPARNLLDTLG